MRTVGPGSLETEADRVSKFEYIVSMFVDIADKCTDGGVEASLMCDWLELLLTTTAEQIYSLAGFDNTCDLSAVLGILGNASVFHAHVQSNAKDVRSKVRNEWGHCNFDHWTALEYIKCFQYMETLVRSLKLPAPDEKKVVDDLHDWETKGQ